MYFNSEDIEEIIFEGYKDDGDNIQNETINKCLRENNIEKGKVSEIKKNL